RRGELAFGLGLRTLGVGLLLLSLLEPQWTSPRPQPGANVLALLADNSQGLQLADPGAATTRGETLRAQLSEDSPWQTRLGEGYQLRRYSFDRELGRVRDFTRLDFSGERSDLGGALRQLQE